MLTATIAPHTLHRIDIASRALVDQADAHLILIPSPPSSIIPKYAAVAQWIERFPPEEEVGGSSPFSRATLFEPKTPSHARWNGLEKTPGLPILPKLWAEPVLRCELP
jgi:hypothetical protein